MKFGAPPPEFRSSSSAETPMSFEKLRKKAEEGSRSESPRENSVDSPFHRPRGPMERGGSRFSEPGNRSRGRITPPNGTPKVQTFGGDLPPEFCAFGAEPSPSIGELAEWGGGMALVFQSAADRSDRLRLKIRDHPRTRGDLPRRLAPPNASWERPRRAPRGAGRSWRGGRKR